MGGTLGNRTDAVKHYKKSEQKWKMELKDLNKQNNMLFSMSKKPGLYCDIKNIRAEASKRRSYYISDRSIRDLDSDLYLSSDSK